jgi:SAM-dependent methyltransferase
VRDFYTRYYAAMPGSLAHAEFCARAYGIDLSQHGFMDLAQMEALVEVAQWTPGCRVLELGCGNGRVAEWLSDRTGARITGIDYIPEAIRQARARAAGKRSRLEFAVQDIAEIDQPEASFDAVLSVDTLYFTSLDATLGRARQLLKPGGRLLAYYSHGTWGDEGYASDTLLPGRTPLAQALQRLGMPFEVWDYTQADLALARRKLAALEDLQARFEAEGNHFLFTNRIDEARGVIRFTLEGRSARYLYRGTR